MRYARYLYVIGNDIDMHTVSYRTSDTSTSAPNSGYSDYKPGREQ